MARVILICVVVILNFHISVQHQFKDALNSEDSSLTNSIQKGNVKSRTFYDYQTRIVAYKDLIESRCLLEFLKNGESLISQNFQTTRLHNLSKNFFMSENQLSKRQIRTLGGQRISEFCRGFPTYLIQELKTNDQADTVLNDISAEDINVNRKIMKRSTKHFFVGRVRGQTQSQYLNYGSSTDAGKAEAESTHEGTKAVVSGTSGMGQAQSQSSPYGCEDCYGEGGGARYGQEQITQYGRPGQPSVSGTGFQRPGLTLEQTGLNGAGRQDLGTYPAPVRPGERLPTLGEKLDQRLPQPIGVTNGIGGGVSLVQKPGPSYPSQQIPGGPEQRYPGQEVPRQPTETIGRYPVGQPELQQRYPGQPPKYTEGTVPIYTSQQIPRYPTQQVPTYPSQQVPSYPSQQIPAGPRQPQPSYIDQQQPSYQQQLPTRVQQVPTYPAAPTYTETQLPDGRGQQLTSVAPGNGGQYQISSRLPSQQVAVTGGAVGQRGRFSGVFAGEYEAYQNGKLGGYVASPRIDGQVRPDQISYTADSGRAGVGQQYVDQGRYISTPETGGRQVGPTYISTGVPSPTGGVRYVDTTRPVYTGGNGGQITTPSQGYVTVPGGGVQILPSQPQYTTGTAGGGQVTIPEQSRYVSVPGGNGQVIQGQPDYITTPVGGGQVGIQQPGYITTPGGGAQITDQQGYITTPGAGGTPIITGDGRQIVPGGGAQIISGDGRQIIPGGGGQIISGDGRQIVPGGGAQIISGDGRQIVPGGGGQIISGDGRQIVPGGGGQIISGDGRQIIPGGGGQIISGDGRQIVPGGGGQIISGDGRQIVPGGIQRQPVYNGGYGPEITGGVQTGTEQVGADGYYDQYGRLVTGGQDVTGQVDDSDSQVQTSVQQTDNETQATALANGKFGGGTAQSQVSGTYTGSGSFSASAGSDDGKRGAMTQVSGGKEGALSSAQGRGGLGQSQAQVQLSSETGDTVSNAQSGGWNHATQTQVQASGKGGMADAQANGPGSTSSQAQIGFTPYDENEEEDGQSAPFKGGGTASAQGGTYAGQTQSQIQGKFLYGIRYTGAAQAGSGSADTIASARNQSRPSGLSGTFPPFKPLTFTPGKITTSQSHQTQTHSQSQQTAQTYTQPEQTAQTHTSSQPFGKTHAQSQPSGQTHASSQPSGHTQSQPSGQTHSQSQPSEQTYVQPHQTQVHTQPQQATQSQSKKNFNIHDQMLEQTETEEVTSSPEIDQSGDDYNAEEYDDYEGDYTTEKPATKTIISQTSRNQRQHVVLDPLEELDAMVTQTYGESPKDGAILQPGEHIPGSPGYQIPQGFRGRVKSIASGQKTYALGRHSQAQTVTLTPGTGRIVYKKPLYSVSSNTHSHNGQYGYGSGYTYQPIQYQVKSGKSPPNFISVSKSETGSRNLYTGKKTPSVYYTQSSSCGVFTNTCVFSGSGKICFPKPKTNPDGSLMAC